MVKKLHFLGRSETAGKHDLARCVADFLLKLDPETPVPDLSRTLLVLPGQNAIRLLTDLLAAGKGVFPPAAATSGGLIHFRKHFSPYMLIGIFCRIKRYLTFWYDKGYGASNFVFSINLTWYAVNPATTRNIRGFGMQPNGCCTQYSCPNYQKLLHFVDYIFGYIFGLWQKSWRFNL